MAMAPPDRDRKVDNGIVVVMAATERQVPRILSQGKLEAQGFQFVCSSSSSGSWVMTPAGIPVQLGRCARGNTPKLHGHFGPAGAVRVCNPGDASAFPLMAITGANIHVSGSGWGGAIRHPSRRRHLRQGGRRKYFAQ